MTLVNNYASQNRSVSVIYSCARKLKLNGIKQQPFYCAHSSLDKEFGQGAVGMAHLCFVAVELYELIMCFGY